MALHIKDAVAEDAIREIARLRKTSLTDAVRLAAQQMLRQEKRKIPVAERLAPIHQMVKAMPNSGERADKAFFDELWGEND